MFVVGLACFALLLVATGFATVRDRSDHEVRTDLSAVGWPRDGQAALVLGDDRPTASPHQRPVAIASLAKVMTAYLTLRRHPLSGAQDGFTITITAAEAQAEAEDAAQDESVVAVRAGERLTERQLLEALLIPSGNNIAGMLAARMAGSETAFVTEMNAEAHALGMNHTTYTDPSGFDPGTVSTAADQLRVFRQAMGVAAFRQIVSTARVTLPVAGTVTNYNPLIAEGYGGKTGSDSAAAGCLAFFTHVTVGGRRLTAVGVVLGQGEGSDTSALLTAAGKTAQRLVESVASSGRDAHGHVHVHAVNSTTASARERMSASPWRRYKDTVAVRSSRTSLTSPPQQTVVSASAGTGSGAAKRTRKSFTRPGSTMQSVRTRPASAIVSIP